MALRRRANDPPRWRRLIKRVESPVGEYWERDEISVPKPRAFISGALRGVFGALPYFNHPSAG